VSIVILKDISGSPNSYYFSFGITDADKLRAGLARPWPTGQVAARTPACHARGVTGQTASFIRLFDRHCLFERSRPQPVLISLTSSTPKRTTMATICLTSSILPAASSPLLHPRKWRAPHEEIETAPSVIGAPDIAAILLTSSPLRAPSGSAIQPGSYDSLTSARALRKNSFRTPPRRKTPYISVGRTGRASAAREAARGLPREPRDAAARQLHALVRRPAVHSYLALTSPHLDSVTGTPPRFLVPSVCT
jgi:hypothetical protein